MRTAATTEELLLLLLLLWHWPISVQSSYETHEQQRYRRSGA